MELMPDKGRHRKYLIIEFTEKQLKNTAELDAGTVHRYIGRK